MADVADIYRAAGATVDEENGMITMVPGQLKPFDIVLRVYPTGYEYMGLGDDLRMTFAIILDDKLMVKDPEPGKEFLGPTLHTLSYDETLSLPADQVRLANDQNRSH